ncbi:hypothetical protein [Aquimarina rubra]|uniref:Adhesin domain-containing protein n=1 Tax=Aquimarina rubra TaxID=1920033 RepID=A0ABW5LGD5_9FLAO
MRKLFFFFIAFILSIHVSGQSTFDKSIDATGLSEVFILLDNTFQIEVKNTSENKIIVSALSEGEYQNDILVNAKRKENTLTIMDDIQPFSENHNDKLSAHKVIVLKIKIQVPSHLKVTIQSRIASLRLNGDIKSLFVELNSGDCLLHHFVGNATINTLQGDITIHTKNATVNASTKSGTLYEEKIYGQHLIDLKSISGNISVYKTK